MRVRVLGHDLFYSSLILTSVKKIKATAMHFGQLLKISERPRSVSCTKATLDKVSVVEPKWPETEP